MQVFYVGKGRGRRAYDSGYRNPHWCGVARKHGHEVEIAAEWSTEREALDHEIFLIDTFRELGHPLVNMTNGGDGMSGFSPSLESRLAKSDSMTRHWADPDAREAHLAAIACEKTRKRMSIAAKERWRDPDKRVSASASVAASVRRKDVREKISSTLSRWWSDGQNKQRMSVVLRAAAARPEQKARASAAKKKLWQSDAYVKKMDAIHSSEEFRQKMSTIARASNVGRSKPVLCHQNGIIYPSTLAAAKELGLHQSAISSVCRGRTKTTGGHSFAFISESTQARP